MHESYCNYPSDPCDCGENKRQAAISALKNEPVLFGKIEQLQAELEDWRNKEGSVCPEDVGFVEYIGKLQAENKRLRDFINKKHPPHRHDHDYFHNDCSLCRREKEDYVEVDQALKGR